MRKRGLLASLRTYLLAGVLVAAPAGITVWLALWFLTFVDNSIIPLIPVGWNPETYLPFSVPGLGLLIVLIFLVLLGMLTAGMVGRGIRAQGARAMARVPVLRSIYSATEQIFETVLVRQGTAFREVALVEFPRRGSWVLGLVTGTTVGEVQELTADEVINVFVPMTPNPTGGFLIFLANEDVHRLDISVDQALKLIMSGGIVGPDSGGGAENGTRQAAEARVSEQLEELGRTAKEGPLHRAPKKRSRFLARLRTYLVTGVLVAAPISITVWLAWQIISFFDVRVRPLIPQDWNPETYLPFAIPGIGIIIVLAVLILLGMFVAGFVGRWALKTGENILNRVPILRSIYKAIKQVFETLFSQQSMAFREVVLIEYPRRNVYALAFVTGGNSELLQAGAQQKVINVFVPSTPNPTSGFLLFVSPDDAVVLKMKVEEAMKMIVSGGLLTPESKEADEAVEGDKPSQGDRTAEPSS
ncbi:MAG: DUF502 domain-containing protein [Kiloniellales bacterium]